MEVLDLAPKGNGIDWRRWTLARWNSALDKIDADVCVLVNGTFGMGPMRLEASLRRRFDRVCAVEHMHTPLAPRPPLRQGIGLWWHRNRIRGRLHSVFPHRVIGVSRAVVRTLVEDYGYPGRKVVAVHGGIDMDRFQPSPERRTATRRALGLSDEAFVFGTVGRLSPMKNHRMLLDAFARTLSDCGRDDIQLVIAGEGPLESELRDRAHELGIDDRVRFVGFVDRPETIHPAFDVFCSTSLGEALGLSLLESMACAVPVLATSVGGVPEILEDHFPEALIGRDDPVGFARAMRQAIEADQGTVQRLGHAMRVHAVRHFDARDCFDRFVDEVLPRGRGESGGSV